MHILSFKIYFELDIYSTQINAIILGIVIRKTISAAANHDNIQSVK